MATAVWNMLHVVHAAGPVAARGITHTAVTAMSAARAAAPSADASCAAGWNEGESFRVRESCCSDSGIVLSAPECASHGFLGFIF